MSGVHIFNSLQKSSHFGANLDNQLIEGEAVVCQTFTVNRTKVFSMKAFLMNLGKLQI